MRTQWGCWQYKTRYAQTYADERHKNKPKHIKLTKAVEKFVDEKILVSDRSLIRAYMSSWKQIHEKRF